MTTLSNELRTARKPYKCEWCGGDIKKGDIYRHEVIADNGLRSWRSHSICAYFAGNYCEDYNGDGISMDEFCETVYEEALQRGMDTELDAYELVKLIMEESHAKKNL